MVCTYFVWPFLSHAWKEHFSHQFVVNIIGIFLFKKTKNKCKQRPRMSQDKNERYFFLPDCRSIHVHSHARVGEVLDGVVGRAAGASVKAHGNLFQQNFLDFLLELWKTGREKKVNISKKKKGNFQPRFYLFFVF